MFIRGNETSNQEQNSITEIATETSYSSKSETSTVATTIQSSHTETQFIESNIEIQQESGEHHVRDEMIAELMSGEAEVLKDHNVIG